MDRLQAHRAFFANLVTARAGGPNSRLTSVFAATRREHYLDPGPWKVFTGAGYIETPSDDPAFLYQDITVALVEKDSINNGQPSLHAYCLSALQVKEGETVVHIGAGMGYYTALLARLTGPAGKVFAYEIHPDLGHKAIAKLAELPHVTVYPQSGALAKIPDCDVIYVSAGATSPLDAWLDALRPGGRLLLPLTPDGVGEMPGPGSMLLVTRASGKRLDARFIIPVMFIPCVGARDPESAKHLAAAFQRGDAAKVCSLRRHTPPDATSWCAGDGWWLSTAPDTDADV